MDDDFKPRTGSGKKRAASSGRKSSGRGGVACESCRLKKVSCDLVFPACGRCKAKGDEESCSFQNLLQFEDPSELPSSRLRAKLDRLEALVKLRSPTRSFDIPRTLPSPQKPTRAVSAPSSLAGASPLPSPTARNLERDAEMASRLLVGPLERSTVHKSTTIDFAALLGKLADADARLPPQPMPQLAEPTSLLSRPTVEDIQRLMQLMPTHRQATAAIRNYFSRVNPVLHVLHRQTFEAQCEAFWAKGATDDGKWLGVYLAVCGNGLLAMSEEEAGACSMPVGEGKNLLVRSWIDGALQALCSGGFTKTPTLQGLSAVALLNTFYASWGGGQFLDAAVSFNLVALSAAWEMELHRDPDELDTHFTPLDAEMRRRVFWALFSLDTLSRSFLGTAYQPHDASAISCRFPSELPDETFDLNFAASTSSSSCTPPLRSTSALHSICLTLAKISRARPPARLPSPVELRALQDDLAGTADSAADDSEVKPFHEVLRSYAYLKLARGLVNLEDRAGENGGSHYRAVTVHHAYSLLDALDSVPKRGAVSNVYTALACMSAAVTLAVGTSDSASDDAHALTSTLHTVEHTAWHSSVLRIFVRGSTVLHTLAATLDATSGRAEPNGLTAPASAFLSTGHSHSPGSASSGFDTTSMVDTPFFIPSSTTPGNYLRGDQYLSPLPYADSFHSESYYEPQPSHGGQLGDYAVPTPAAGSHSQGGSYDSYTKRASGEDRQLAPLVKPWLASTASTTLVSPLTEFNMASWSRGLLA